MFGVLVIVGEKAIDEGAPLVCVRVREKGPKVLRRGQQAPDVKVGAPGECGVANQCRRWTTVLTEIRCDEPIDRCRPVSPENTGDHRTRERKWSFPLRPRRGGRDRFSGAFVDPDADGRDFAGGEWRPAQRHRRRRVPCDAPYQEASRRVAGADGRAGAASLERVDVRGERQSARTALGAVAAQALRRKNGVDLLTIIDGRGVLRLGSWDGPQGACPQARSHRQNNPRLHTRQVMLVEYRWRP